MSDADFGRTLLRVLRRDMKRAKTKRPTNYWTLQMDKSHWEFQAPCFYWYGRASSSFEARYNGILHWIEKNDPAGYQRLENLK